MKEFLYDVGQKTGPQPKITKLGALKLGMEQTPVIFKGQPIICESQAPDDICNQQYIRIRNMATGEISKPFAKNYYFASAFADNDTLYVFATSTHDDGKLTYGLTEDESEWHDPRGGHEVRMFYTKDLLNIEEKDIIVAPELRLWNTSVCKGKDSYILSIEVRAEAGYNIPSVGVDFTTFFAESTDMLNWKMMDYTKYYYTDKRYNACPSLRYYDGWYYMICLESFPCQRYAPYIYRTKDFENWYVGFHNPMMMWSDEDRTPHKDSHFNAEELDLLQHGLNINCSDLDFVEIDGKTHIYYANGDQLTYSFLCEAVFDGTEQEFLESFFK